MIIDIHTHVPPQASWDRYLQECRAYSSVASSLGVSGWPHCPDADVVRGANEQAAEFAGYAGGMVLWFAYINPHADGWKEEIARCFDAGARGIKLWVSLKHEETGSMDATRAVLKHLEGCGKPVLIHTFHRTDDNLPGELTVAEFAELAADVPGLDMIAAHSGCNWRQALGLLDGLGNAYVDICGGYPETGMVESLVDDLGAERVLYGSDALGRSFPSQIAKVRFADIGADDAARILTDNSVALLNLTEEELSRAAGKMASVPERETLSLPDMGTDHFCFLGSLPFRGTPVQNAAALDDRLASRGLHKAYVADGANLYAADVLLANRQFAETAGGTARLVPLATLLPYVPNWEPILREARQAFAGGIVFPYLHNWQLDDPAYTAFFAACAEAKFPLWINACTADARFRHRGTLCRSVARDELLHFLDTAPPNAYVFQGVGGPDVAACLKQNDRGDVRFDISRLTDNTSALTDIVTEHGCDRLVLGSEFPFRNLSTVAWTARRLCGWEQGAGH
jgi:predicted TIM-barrel fold metal-dependent hydrolase